MVLTYLSKIKSTLLVLVILASTSVSFAQDAELGPDPCVDPDLPCPIDGGLSLLIAAAVGIGAKKAYSQRRPGADTTQF